MTQQRRFSLLWPQSQRPQDKQSQIPQRTARDLGVENTVRAFSNENVVRNDLRDILFNLITDEATITYRQDIVQDLLDHPAVAETLRNLLPQISALAAYRYSVDRKRSSLQQLAWRASELEYMVEVTNSLHEALTSAGTSLQSEGFKQLLTTLEALKNTSAYQNLERELPEILPQLRANVSVTVGINLDRELRPIEATLLSVNSERFESASLLDRLFGRADVNSNTMAPIHRAPQDIYGGLAANKELANRGYDPMMVPLFRDLAEVLNKVARPVEKALRKYVQLNGNFLGELRGEIVFFLAAVDMAAQFQKHDLPMCRPKIQPMDARICRIEGSFNLNLARHLIATNPGIQITDQITLNDINFDDNGRIQILTGPNQGGKTTYTQMIGLNQILAQAGFLIPGKSAEISPVVAIYTHYPIEEELELSTGRFGDEAKRLGEIFKAADAHSLILLNESLSSTSPGESIFIAQDLVRAMRMMGTRAVFGTHMHELARKVADLNDSVDGDSRVISMVASRVEEDVSTDEHAEIGRRSYQVEPGEPMGRSYADEIARQYGISFDQLIENMKGVAN